MSRIQWGNVNDSIEDSTEYNENIDSNSKSRSNSTPEIEPGIEPGKQSKSNSCSDSNSDPNPDSDSDSDCNILESFPKPIFIQKKRNPVSTSHEPAPLNLHIPIPIQPLRFPEFDGIDDTDDLDPELEYQMWQHRRDLRKVRDRASHADKEASRNEAIKRVMASLLDM